MKIIPHGSGVRIVFLQIDEQLPWIVAGLPDDVQQVLVSRGGDIASAQIQLAQDPSDEMGDSLGVGGFPVMLISRHLHNIQAHGPEAVFPESGSFIGNTYRREDQGQSLYAIPSRVGAEHGMSCEDGSFARKDLRHEPGGIYLHGAGVHHQGVPADPGSNPFEHLLHGRNGDTENQDIGAQNLFFGYPPNTRRRRPGNVPGPGDDAEMLGQPGGPECPESSEAVHTDYHGTDHSIAGPRGANRLQPPVLFH